MKKATQDITPGGLFFSYQIPIIIRSSGLIFKPEYTYSSYRLRNKSKQQPIHGIRGY